MLETFSPSPLTAMASLGVTWEWRLFCQSWTMPGWMVLWHSMHAWVASLTLTSAAGTPWGKTRRLTAANQKRVLFIRL